MVKLLASVTPGQGQGLFQVDGQIVSPFLDSKKSMSKIIGVPGVVSVTTGGTSQREQSQIG